MRIKRVKIKNFRTIYEADIEFYDVTSFVGPNGVGKSTILYALDWFFNGNRQGILTSQDATYNHEKENTEVQVTFDHLNEADREFLGKYSSPASETFTAWKKRDYLDGREFLSANQKGYKLMTPLKDSTISASKIKELYRALQEEHPEMNLPDAPTRPKIMDAVHEWEAAHLDELEDLPEEVSTDFNGFNSNAAMASRFTFAFVKADLRANEEAADGRNSLLSSIVERSINRKSADDQLKSAFTGIIDNERQIYDDVFGSQLAELSSQLNQVVNDYSAGRSVTIEPNIQEILPPKTTFHIRVNDGSYQTEVTKQGHGFQRTLLISALQMLSEQNVSEGKGTLCLAIEEPELFQHPTQARVFASVLRELAEDTKQELQVTYATHSQYFLEAKHFDQIYRLVRSNQVNPCCTQINHASMEDVIEKINQFYNAKKIRSTLEQTYEKSLPIGIFSNEVILVEGSSDQAIVEATANLESRAMLDKSGVAVIPCSTKSTIILHHAILNALGIPTKIMFDNDSGWESRFQKDESKKDSERKTHESDNNKMIKYFHIAPEDVTDWYPNPGFHGDLLVVDDTLEPYLENEWLGWNQAYEQVLDELGKSVSKKDASSYTMTIQRLNYSDCPCALHQFIDSALCNVTPQHQKQGLIQKVNN